MPGTTVRGYPYPLPTEPVAEGAQAIRNLAESVDALGSFDLIAAQKRTSTGIFDFSAIPQRYDFLTLKIYVRAYVNLTNDQLCIRFNNDGAANYAGQQLLASATTVGGATMPVGPTFGRVGLCAGDAAPAGQFSAGEIEIYGCRSATYKTWLGKTQSIYGAAQAVALHGGHWNGAAAINRIQLLNEQGPGTGFISGSIAALYGLRAS